MGGEGNLHKSTEQREGGMNEKQLKSVWKLCKYTIVFLCLYIVKVVNKRNWTLSLIKKNGVVSIISKRIFWRENGRFYQIWISVGLSAYRSIIGQLIFVYAMYM